MTYVIGLTGGIGSGKTLISDHFSKLQVPIIDTDVIARQVVEPGEKALNDLVDQFGTVILQNNGQLDRSQLRNIAFSNDENKAILDAITHPAIRQEAINQINNTKQAYCLVVVPLLSQASPFTAFMHRILVVTADRATKIERVKVRSNLTESEITRIMSTQLDDKDRLRFADDVINNDGSIGYAHSQVESLHAQYLDLAAFFKTNNNQ